MPENESLESEDPGQQSEDPGHRIRFQAQKPAEKNFGRNRLLKAMFTDEEEDDGVPAFTAKKDVVPIGKRQNTRRKKYPKRPGANTSLRLNNSPPHQPTTDEEEDDGVPAFTAKKNVVPIRVRQKVRRNRAAKKPAANTSPKTATNKSITKKRHHSPSADSSSPGRRPAPRRRRVSPQANADGKASLDLMQVRLSTMEQNISANMEATHGMAAAAEEREKNNQRQLAKLVGIVEDLRDRLPYNGQSMVDGNKTKFYSCIHVSFSIVYPPLPRSPTNSHLQCSFCFPTHPLFQQVYTHI